MEFLFKTESLSNLLVHISFTNSRLVIEVSVEGLIYTEILFLFIKFVYYNIYYFRNCWYDMGYLILSFSVKLPRVCSRVYFQ